MNLHRGFACGAGLVVAVGLIAGCEEAKEKAKRIIDEQSFKAVEGTGEAIREKADAAREAIGEKASEGLEKAGERMNETAEKESPADAELRKEAGGKTKPAEEEDLSK